jgi:hypothetical protein
MVREVELHIVESKIESRSRVKNRRTLIYLFFCFFIIVNQSKLEAMTIPVV